MQLYVDFPALTEVLQTAADSGRFQLFEHETYNFLSSLGAESAPRSLFLPQGARLEEEQLTRFPGDRVVLKVVSPHIVHKSDVGGVMVVEKKAGKVRSSRRRMHDSVCEKFSRHLEKHPDEAPESCRGLSGIALQQAVARQITGVLVTQFMPPDSESLGNELLVSLRLTREFGMVITAGLGGTDTELYASRFRPGQAVVSASTAATGGEEFFTLFQKTIGYEKLAGLTRGGRRLASDSQLLECFSAFIEVGNFFSPHNPQAPFHLEELEINPFAFVDYEMVPLDGLCHFKRAEAVEPRRDKSSIASLLYPQSVAIAGVSSRKQNFGRLILGNLLKSGFAPENLHLLSRSAGEIDGVGCVRSLTEIDPVDLLVVAVSAEQALELLDAVIDDGVARSVILIPSGFGEKEGTKERAEQLIARIKAAQSTPGGPVILGGNCMGMVSRPGKVDTFFVPENLTSRRRELPPSNVALLSQSGAFSLSRMMNLVSGDPLFNLTMGNQTDLTIADLTGFMAGVDEVGVIGIYAEGFTDMDGLYLIEAIKQAMAAGKEVIVYKAGRTPEGRKATSGHTSSVAGDYAVSISCLTQAGALVAESITEFEGLLNLASVLHDKPFRGNRVAGMTPAGYEAVGIADSLQGVDTALTLAELSEDGRRRLAEIFEEGGLAEIMDIHMPLDVTPAAGDAVLREVLQLLQEESSVDSIVVSAATISPATGVTPGEEVDACPVDGFFRSLPGIIRQANKPIVVFNDAGSLHRCLNEVMKENGIPVFDCCDHAVSFLSRYTAYRLRVG